jgi:hypothetical protein
MQEVVPEASRFSIAQLAVSETPLPLGDVRRIFEV